MRLSGGLGLLGLALVVASFVVGDPVDPYATSWAWPLVASGVLILVVAAAIGLVAGSPRFQGAVIVTLGGGFTLAMGVRLVIPYDSKYVQTWSPLLAPLLLLVGVALTVVGVARGRAAFRRAAAGMKGSARASTRDSFVTGLFLGALLVPATGFLLAFGIFRFGGYCPGNCLAPVWQDASLFGGLALLSLALACLGFVVIGVVSAVAWLVRQAAGR